MGGKVILTKTHRFGVGSAFGELELGGSNLCQHPIPRQSPYHRHYR